MQGPLSTRMLLNQCLLDDIQGIQHGGSKHATPKFPPLTTRSRCSTVENLIETYGGDQKFLVATVPNASKSTNSDLSTSMSRAESYNPLDIRSRRPPKLRLLLHWTTLSTPTMPQAYKHTHTQGHMYYDTIIDWSRGAKRKTMSLCGQQHRFHPSVRSIEANAVNGGAVSSSLNP